MIEGETREGKQRRTRRRVSVRRRGDPGEIQGRSIDLRGSVFRGVGGSMGKGIRAKRGLGRWGRGRDKDDRVWKSPWESREK